MDASGQLHEITSKEELSELATVLKQHLPRSVCVYNYLLQLHVQPLQELNQPAPQPPQGLNQQLFHPLGISTKIYTDRSLGTNQVLIIIIEQVCFNKKCPIYLFCSAPYNRIMAGYLQYLLDWSKSMEFSGLDEFQMELVQDLCELNGMMTSHEPCWVYSLWPRSCFKKATSPSGLLPPSASKVVATSPSGSISPVASTVGATSPPCSIPPSPPSSCTVARVGPEHAGLVDSCWKFSDEGTKEMIEKLCQSGKVFGAFYPGDNEPAAWMFQYHFGSLGNLFTRKKYRQKGYGGQVARLLIEYTRNQGLEPYVHIEDYNILSMELFVKLGFTKQTRACWIHYSPN